MKYTCIQLELITDPRKLSANFVLGSYFWDFYPDSKPVWGPCGIRTGKPTLPIPSRCGLRMGFEWAYNWNQSGVHLDSPRAKKGQARMGPMRALTGLAHAHAIPTMPTLAHANPAWDWTGLAIWVVSLMNSSI